MVDPIISEFSWDHVLHRGFVCSAIYQMIFATQVDNSRNL